MLKGPNFAIGGVTLFQKMAMIARLLLLATAKNERNTNSLDVMDFSPTDG